METKVDKVMSIWHHLTDSIGMPPTKKRRSEDTPYMDYLLRSVEKGNDRTTSKYRPWDKKDFEERVASFSPSTWFAKPLAVSPLQCARYIFSFC